MLCQLVEKFIRKKNVLNIKFIFLKENLQNYEAEIKIDIKKGFINKEKLVQYLFSSQKATINLDLLL